MRHLAFAALLAALLAAGLLSTLSDALQPPVHALDCPVATSIVSKGERMECVGAIATMCSRVRPGLRYQGCLDSGPMSGAILLMRGLPLSASRATLDDFVALQGVGPGIAGRLVAARQDHPFCSLDDLRRVSGIGAKRAVAIGAHLSFDDPFCAARPAPVDSPSR